MSNHTDKDFISIKEASILTGIQPQTLRKLGDQQKIQCYRTVSGQRKFHKASLEAMCYAGNQISSFANKQNFIYARVSCNRLNKDLKSQIDAILAKDVEKYGDYQKIMDVSSGTNFKRKGLQTILKACLQKNIGEIVVTRSDRLCIVGFDLIETIVTSCGGRIVALDETSGDVSDNNVVSEMIDILQRFSRKGRAVEEEEEPINEVSAVL